MATNLQAKQSSNEQYLWRERNDCHSLLNSRTLKNPFWRWMSTTPRHYTKHALFGHIPMRPGGFPFESWRRHSSSWTAACRIPLVVKSKAHTRPPVPSIQSHSLCRCASVQHSNALLDSQLCYPKRGFSKSRHHSGCCCHPNLCKRVWMTTNFVKVSQKQ